MMEKNKAPGQRLYDAIFRQSKRLGYTTYTHSPPKEKGYPFVRLGGVQFVPSSTKTRLLGEVFADFDIWGDGTDRNLISGMAAELVKALTRDENINGPDAGYKLQINLNETNIEVRPDQSTNNDLWRAHVETVFRII